MPLSSSNFEYTTNIPAFLSKLWTLVEDEKNNELIAWDPSGFSFHVYDQTRFSREILPRFFKHNNMASFIRQLNMYGFRKVNSIDHGSLRNEKEDMEFHHPYFLKDKEQFLEYIKRKVPDIKQGLVNMLNGNSLLNSQQASLPNNQQQQLTPHNNSQVSIKQFPQIKPDEINKVLDDVNTIKSKQKMVDESLFAVKKENEALWKEIASLRQKHHHQQHIVNKLIHFLVHLVNPASMTNLKRARPLMIDSHASSFIDPNDNSYINDEASSANGTENQIIINTTKLNDSDSQKRRQLVDLNDTDDLVTEEVLSPSYNQIGVNNKNELYNTSYLDDAEIETINNAKTQGRSSNSTGIKPTVKRLKSSDFQFMNGTKSQLIKNGNFQNYQLVNNNNNNINNNNIINDNNNTKTIVINNTNNSNENSNLEAASAQQANNTFNDTNLFVNSMENQANLIDSINLVGNNSSQPIVSLPVSPGLNPPNLNTNNNNNVSRITSESDDQTESENTIAENNQLKRAISSMKNSTTNPNNMNEHIESLQIDLNSIKEFLTTSAYNQPDTYNTINNLFSPNNSIILDQIDNEPGYFEAPMNNSINNDLHNRDTYIQNHLSDSMISQTQEQNNNNGKVIGFDRD